ncbi:hypothetical protein FB468_1029 [Leucobacter komagatae]|uniref:Uncharacterized protein n=1 Tax=Leucobacter komagatae TaxID=55969 RepID=A0A542Y4M0_9MICO|nr:hypothetical protein [Leucobacter komagatae]TQL43017.1 hypothetical protein FB468_1029 [Leucobacter komagatae]
MFSTFFVPSSNAPGGVARRGRRRRRWAALAVALPIILAGAVPAAQGASFEGMLSFAGYHVGAFTTTDGARAYCLEPGADAPVSAQLRPTRVSSLPGYSIAIDDAWGWKGTVRTSPTTSDQMRQMNWLLAEHGERADAAKAVAVQVALWEIRREPGNAEWLDAKYRMFGQNGGQSHVDAGKRLAAEARTSALAPGNVAPKGALAFAEGVEPGAGDVLYPAGTTELRIVGGTFADGSTAVALDSAAAGSVGWVALPNEPEWSRTTTVRVTGRWSLPEKWWPAELVLHPASRETEQRIGAGVKPVLGEHGGGFGEIAHAFDREFAPEISTQVADPFVLREDGVFEDTVAVDVATGEWPTRGEPDEPEYLPLVADGTLYGPFEEPQAEQAEAPEGAPVAGESSLSIDRGPGEYRAELSISSPGSGYYYWVWRIREELQSPEVRGAGFFEPGAVFADRFAVFEERQVVATDLQLETRLVNNSLAYDDRWVEDMVRATAQSGVWVRDDAGDRIPANVRITFYRTEGRPLQQPTVPAEAEALGSVVVPLASEQEWVAAKPFAVPRGAAGWVTARACIDAKDQPEEHRGMLRETCDDFGVPSETAELLPKPADLARTGASVSPRSAGEGLAAMLGAGASGLGGLLLGIVALRRRSATNLTHLQSFWRLSKSNS